MVSIIFSMARSPPALDTLFLDALRTAISSKLCGACVYTLTSPGDSGARGKPVSVRDDDAQPAVVSISAIANVNPLAMQLTSAEFHSQPPQVRPVQHRLWSCAS